MLGELVLARGCPQILEEPASRHGCFARLVVDSEGGSAVGSMPLVIKAHGRRPFARRFYLNRGVAQHPFYGRGGTSFGGSETIDHDLDIVLA